MNHFNRRDRIQISTYACIFLGSLLALTGCVRHDAKTDLLRSSSSLPQTYAGQPIRLSLTLLDPSWQSATKVEVSVDQVVSETLSDHDISSAKVELKPIFKSGNALELEIPTTESFKPGIWHISELRFYRPDKKAWVDYKAGVDYSGLAFRLINSTNTEPKEGKLRLDKVEMVSP